MKKVHYRPQTGRIWCRVEDDFRRNHPDFGWMLATGLKATTDVGAVTCHACLLKIGGKTQRQFTRIGHDS